MARRVSIEIVGDAASAQRAFKATRLGAEETAGAIGKLSISFAALAKSTVVIYAVAKALEALGGAVHSGISEFKETSQIQAQTAAVLKSTGDASNVTAKQVHGLSLELSNLSGISDEAIQASENVLLSFTNIRDFAGKNNDVFTQATKAVVDYSARTGKDASTAALIFGRALEDPAEKVAALSRAGIVFTKQQREQIKAIQNTKGVLEAQKLLIRDLELRYAGAAAAAGKTLPGALNILKERFRDLAGEGIAKVAGPLTGATVALSKFVVALTEAHGARAKLDVFVQGLATLGRDIVSAAVKQVESINFARVASVVGDKLAAVDWRAQIERAARALSSAVIVLLQRLRSAINSVNWNQVGHDIAIGIEKAVAAVADFLAHVNWAQVVRQLVLTLAAAVKAVGGLFLGIGETIGKQILGGIELGLRAAGAALEKLAIRIVLKIIEPFSRLPGYLGGGPFQRMKASFQQTLNDMQAAAGAGGAAIGSSVGQNMLSQVQAYTAAAKKLADPGATALGPPIPGKTANATSAGGGAGLPAAPTGPGAGRRVGISASQRNTFFDNAMSRILTRGGLGSISRQIAALEKADGLIAARLKVTKDVTRRLNLEDQLLQNQSQIKTLRGQAAAEALQKQQDARAKALSALVSRQFRQLGLSATGDPVTPGVAGLKKRLGQLSANVKASSLNTPKLQSELARFRKVLREGLVPKDVRAKIKEMMDQISDELKNSGQKHLTKFKHANASALLAGLGLDAETTRILRQRLAQVGAGGTVPGSHSAAFAGAGTTVVHTTVNLDGKKVAENTTKHQRRHSQRRSESRRGPYAGRN